MNYLIIEASSNVKIWTLEISPKREVNWNGRYYMEVSVSNHSPVFYDWVRDCNGRIIGLELQFWREHIPSLCDLHLAFTRDANEFPVIMFSSGVEGTGDATQGFGDIHFYHCAAGQWLIMIGTDLWLRPGDMLWLEQLAQA